MISDFINRIKAYKDFKILFGAVFLILIIIFTFLYLKRESDIAMYMEKIKQVEDEIDSTNKEINKVMNSLNRRQDELLSEFNDLSVLLSDQMNSRQIGEEFFKFLEKPESRKLYREQQAIIIDDLYGELYNELDLIDIEEEELRELLVDREMINLEILVTLIKGNMTDDQKKENERKFNDMLDKTEKDIRDFFDDDEYRIYENYMLTLEYRNFIKDFRSYLQSSDMDLDFEQEERLLDEIINETNNFVFTEDIDLLKLRGRGEIDDETINRIRRHLDEKAELDDLIYEKSRDFLDRSQYEKLREYQLLIRNMTAMGIEVASDMDMKRGTE